MNGEANVVNIRKEDKEFICAVTRLAPDKTALIKESGWFLTSDKESYGKFYECIGVLLKDFHLIIVHMTHKKQDEKFELYQRDENIGKGIYRYHIKENRMLDWVYYVTKYCLYSGMNTMARTENSTGIDNIHNEEEIFN